jgi:predicted amidohydrolase YtcJ
MAAAARSVSISDLQRVASDRPPGEWIRAVGYHESSDGPLDRDALDRLVPDRPVRVQHASGAMWVLNTPALAALGLDVADGRLYGCDELLQERLGGSAPDLAGVGGALAAVGVTAVTDATPGLRSVGPVPQRVNFLGDGKIVVSDHAPPDIDELVDRIRAARPLPVGFHCASRLALVLTIAALEMASAHDGDRIEHGAVIPDDALPALRRLGVTVVTQPAFVHERGDRYLADVDEDDRPYLWRCGSLRRAGIAVAGSSDAPYGPADPWQAMRAAVARRTAGGRVLGEGERIAPWEALNLFLTPVEDPGGAPRRVRPGVSDLCLLHVPLAVALADLDAANVRMTFYGSEAGRSNAVRSSRPAPSYATALSMTNPVGTITTKALKS